jgi:hypothetical protein
MEIAINYFAVIAAAVAAMALGYVWYGPLFGKQWMALMGFTKESMQSMSQSAMQSYGIMAVAALITAYVLNHIIVFSSNFYDMAPGDYTTGLISAFWIWLGFVATTQVGAVLWESKPWKLFFLNTGYSLVSLAIMGVILSVWV